MRARTLMCVFAGAGLPFAAASSSPAQAPLRIPFPQDDGTLTPYTFEVAYPLVTLVYDTLTWRDADGVPKPWLARTVSQQGRRITVTLRDGARWHDGRALTSRDVAFTFRWFARRLHPRFTPQLHAIRSVRTRGRDTVVFRLRHGAPGFRDQPLADVPILPRHLWKDVADDELAPRGLPVGSGPYRLVAHRPRRGYSFRANRAYFLGPPAVEAIEVPFIRQAATMFRALERGAADMVPISLPAPADRELEDLGVRVTRGPAFLGTVLMFNVRSKPFRSAGARRAVAAAIDVERVARAVPGALAATRGHIHPASRWASRRELRAAPAAREDLAPLTVLVSDADPARMAAGQQIVLALERAGIGARLRPLSARSLAAAVGETGERPRFEAAIWTTPALASYDPDFLRPVFARGGPLNLSGYRSARFERLAARVAAVDDARRRRAVDDVLSLLARDVPTLPLFFAEGAFAHRPAAHRGWIFVKGIGILDKRSLLSEGPASERDPAPLPEATSSGPGGFGWLAVGAAVGAALLAGVALLRRRG